MPNRYDVIFYHKFRAKRGTICFLDVTSFLLQNKNAYKPCGSCFTANSSSSIINFLCYEMSVICSKIDEIQYPFKVYKEPLKNCQVEGCLLTVEPDLLFGNLDELCQVLSLIVCVMQPVSNYRIFSKSNLQTNFEKW